MDQTVLVRDDREIGVQILDALSQAKIPVTLSDWIYVPQLEEWQMIIATPWFDSKGPRTAYRALVDSLTRAGIYERVPVRRIALKSPNDPVVEALRREAKEYREATLYILRHGDQYTVVHPTVTSAGRRVFSTLDELVRFLSRDLGLSHTTVDNAVADAKRTGIGSIGAVRISTREARKLGLI